MIITGGARKAKMTRVQIPFCPLAGVVLDSPWFNCSVILANSQLACLQPMMILIMLCLYQLLLLHSLRTLVFTSVSAVLVKMLNISLAAGALSIQKLA